MTDSIGDVRAVLATATQSLDTAYQHARAARGLLGEAVAVLGELDGQHSESLVPPQLMKATDELDHGLAAIGSGRDAVADLEARL
ncbi:MAG: hypothetical protein QOK35_2344 [Pseudonocardiales bacterium]|jgi:hypothetical protein|nr:hypothetical protein [Pseudonocardiales bacterium]